MLQDKGKGKSVEIWFTVLGRKPMTVGAGPRCLKVSTGLECQGMLAVSPDSVQIQTSAQTPLIFDTLHVVLLLCLTWPLAQVQTRYVTDGYIIGTDNLGKLSFPYTRTPPPPKKDLGKFQD